jgi:hypothetical protein
MKDGRVWSDLPVEQDTQKYGDAAAAGPGATDWKSQNSN